MNKIGWCLKQKKGIKLIEPNDNVSNEYVKSSDENFSVINKVSGKWKAITAYYTCYECLYALLQKIGIKCEIHECSLEIMNLIACFGKKEKNFLTSLKNERIDVQYYLKKPKEIDVDSVKEFMTTCKHKILTITEDEIKKIRAKLTKESDKSLKS